jgi:hypothetical protein
MKEFKLKTGESVIFDIINPTFIHHLDLDFKEEERKSMIDAIDMFCNSPEAKKLRRSENEMLASLGNLAALNHGSIEKAKNAFIEVTDTLMRERIGKDLFDNYFTIYDILVYGTLMSSGTFDSAVRHNYPWTYSGVMFLESPKVISEGEASLMFVNPTVSEEHAESYGVLPLENHMVIFPSHTLVKDRSFRSDDPKSIRATLNFNVKYLPKNLSQQPKSNVIGEGIDDAEFERMMTKNSAKNQEAKNNDW